MQLLFDRHIDTDAVVRGLQRERPARMTPKMFMHTLKDKCKWVLSGEGRSQLIHM